MLTHNVFNFNFWLPEYDGDLDCPPYFKEIEFLKGCRIYKRLSAFFYKYTGNKERENTWLIDGLYLWDLVAILPDGKSNLVKEDGEWNGFEKVTPKFNDEQRWNFLFMLLKCKYPVEQCIRILDYYWTKTGLDRKMLASMTKAGDDWKDIADRMEWSWKGKETSSFNFLDGVMLEEQYAGK